HVIQVDEEDPVAVIREHTDGGVDVALEAVGLGPTAQQAIDVTRNGGHVTWIGNSARIIELDMQSVVTREITVRGSYAFTPKEFAAAVQALAEGRVDVAPLIEKVAPLAEGPTIFRQLASGERDWLKVILEP
ncbi:MAG: galactitol-1-phosphate 5-dehydrogenase, partial [Chloroflexi bacterium]